MNWISNCWFSIEFVSIPSIVSTEEGVDNSGSIEFWSSMLSWSSILVWSSILSASLASITEEIGQSSAQYPYSFWLSMWFPRESTLVEHHLLELSSWSIGQPKLTNQFI